jgi:hypothetical protein
MDKAVDPEELHETSTRRSIEKGKQCDTGRTSTPTPSYNPISPLALPESDLIDRDHHMLSPVLLPQLDTSSSSLMIPPNQSVIRRSRHPAVMLAKILNEIQILNQVVWMEASH